MKNLTKLSLVVTLLFLFASSPWYSCAAGIKAKILTAEFIYEKAPFPSCHASPLPRDCISWLNEN